MGAVVAAEEEEEAEDDDHTDDDEDKADFDDQTDDEADKEEENVAMSCLHSSLWPARHAARWQVSSQYFRWRQLEQKSSRCVVSAAGLPQWSHMAASFAMRERAPG